MKKIIRVAIRLGSYFLIFSFLISCKNHAPDKIEILLSPNQKYELVIAKFTRGGATSSNSIKLYIRRAGSKRKELEDPRMIVDKYENYSVVWENDSLIKVSYNKAQIYHFSNFWYDLEDPEVQKIEIQLRPNLNSAFL
jgi:hypothetical protein